MRHWPQTISRLPRQFSAVFFQECLIRPEAFGHGEGQALERLELGLESLVAVELGQRRAENQAAVFVEGDQMPVERSIVGRGKA